jgi:hypothetical protein
MLPRPVSRGEPWLVYFALAGLFTLVLLALVMLGAGVGVRYGIVNGPSLNIDFGSVRVVASTNPAPDCNPAQPACAAQQLHPAAGPRYYSIWVVTTHKVVTNSGRPEQFGAARVLAVQAGP